MTISKTSVIDKVESLRATIYSKLEAVQEFRKQAFEKEEELILIRLQTSEMNQEIKFLMGQLAPLIREYKATHPKYKQYRAAQHKIEQNTKHPIKILTL